MSLGPGRIVQIVIVASLGVLARPATGGATISLPDQTAAAGQTLVVPVSFSSQGQQVSGLQFDLSWDASLDVKVAIADPLRTSSKLLYAAGLATTSARCLVIGTNGEAIADGDVVKLFVIVGGSAASGAAQLRFANVAATDASGRAVALSASDVNIQIQGAVNVTLQSNTALNAASLLSGAIAPGEVLTLFDYFPQGATFLVNGVAAPVLYAGSNQMNAIVPFGLDVTAPAAVELRNNGQSVAKGTLAVKAASPGIFTQTGIGSGPGAILNEDYSLNSSSNAAAAGSIIMIYGTGFGAVTPTAVDGKTATGPADTVLPVTASIGGTQAAVAYAGAAPGLMAGVAQINVVVPQGLKSNTAVPVSLKIGSAATQDGVTVWIK